jgi:hypothetical protein
MQPPFAGKMSKPERKLCMMHSGALETKCTFCDIVGTTESYLLYYSLRAQQGKKYKKTPEDHAFHLATYHLHVASSPDSDYKAIKNAGNGDPCGLAFAHGLRALQMPWMDIDLENFLRPFWRRPPKKRVFAKSAGKGPRKQTMKSRKTETEGKGPRKQSE